jgi:hypothetical protein
VAQLALAELLMREHGLAALPGGAWTYDPVLGAADRTLVSGNLLHFKDPIQIPI